MGGLKRLALAGLCIVLIAGGFLAGKPHRAEALGAAAKTYRLAIPRLGVDIPVILARRTRTSWSVASLGIKYAGHLQGTPYPGQGGNVVIAAHVELSPSKPGPFIDLDTLQPGDEVLITYGETLYRYVVNAAFTVKPTEVVFAQALPYEVLTLITCAPDSSNTPRGRYALRLIVRAMPG